MVCPGSLPQHGNVHVARGPFVSRTSNRETAPMAYVCGIARGAFVSRASNRETAPMAYVCGMLTSFYNNTEHVVLATTSHIYRNSFAYDSFSTFLQHNLK